MNDIKIVKAEAKDVKAITAILNEAFYADYFKYGYAPPSYKRDEAITEELVKNGCVYLGYLEEIAVCTVTIVPEKEKNAYKIISLATLPQYQGMGLGKKMMDFAHGIAPDAETFVVTTPVDKKTNFDFYIKLGYEIAGRFKEHGNPIYSFKKKIV